MRSEATKTPMLCTRSPITWMKAALTLRSSVLLACFLARLLWLWFSDPSATSLVRSVALAFGAAIDANEEEEEEMEGGVGEGGSDGGAEEVVRWL